MNNQPKEFYISPAGGSGNIGMSTFLSCPQKAKLYYNGWRRKKVSHPMGFGILEHKALFEPRINKEEKRKPPDIFETLYMRGVVPAFKKIDGTQEREIEIDFTDNKGLSINKANHLKTGKEIAEKADYEINQMPIKCCEKQMCVNVLDPDSGLQNPELDGFFFCGRKDVQKENGITDFKTSARSKTQDDVVAGPDHFQLCSYRYMTIIETHKDYKELSILNAINKKIPEIKEFKYTSKDEDLLMVYQTYLWVARQLKEYFRTDYWPRNPASCKVWGICDFHPICWPEKYSRADMEVKDKLYKKGY